MMGGTASGYGFKSGQKFTDFLSLVGYATVRYRLVTDDAADNQGKNVKTNCNGSDRAGKYAALLARDFEAACDEIKSAADEEYCKADKLILAGRYQIEIKSSSKFLTNAPSCGYSHRNFIVLKISPGRDEEPPPVIGEPDFQEFYWWMDHYLEKMHDFLLKLEDSVRVTDQQHFPVPPSKRKGVNDSSAEKPMAFFDYLLLQNGINDLTNKLVPTKEDVEYLDYVRRDTEKEELSVGEINVDTGERELFVTRFIDILAETCTKECVKSQFFIHEQINRLTDEAGISICVKLFLGQLYSLLEFQRSHSHFLRYAPVAFVLEKLVRYIYERYHFFCPAPAEARFGGLLFSHQPQIPLQQKMLPAPIQGMQVFKSQKNVDVFAPPTYIDTFQKMGLSQRIQTY